MKNIDISKMMYGVFMTIFAIVTVMFIGFNVYLNMNNKMIIHESNGTPFGTFVIEEVNVVE